MLNLLIRYFNQNRIKVIGIILAVIFALILIQMLNSTAQESNDNILNEISNTLANSKNTDSVIKEGEVSTNIEKINESIIEEFVKYCNEKNTSNAYNLLSDDCKNVLFPTEEDFINNYCNIVFNEYKVYELENWISESQYVTYKIRYTNDALANGGYINGSTLEDYYTIVKQDDQYKLNINKFVNKETINKSGNNNNLLITVVSRENYIDYQIYEIDFYNQNLDNIQLYDSKQNSTWNVTDKNDLEYAAFVEEVADNNLIIESGEKQKLKIKYAKMYNPSRKIESMKFNKMYCQSKPEELFNITIKIR